MGDAVLRSASAVPNPAPQGNGAQTTEIKAPPPKPKPSTIDWMFNPNRISSFLSLGTASTTPAPNAVVNGTLPTPPRTLACSTDDAACTAVRDQMKDFLSGSQTDHEGNVRSNRELMKAANINPTRAERRHHRSELELRRALSSELQNWKSSVDHVLKKEREAAPDRPPPTATPPIRPLEDGPPLNAPPPIADVPAEARQTSGGHTCRYRGPRLRFEEHRPVGVARRSPQARRWLRHGASIPSGVFRPLKRTATS